MAEMIGAALIALLLYNSPRILVGFLKWSVVSYQEIREAFTNRVGQK